MKTSCHLCAPFGVAAILMLAFQWWSPYASGATQDGVAVTESNTGEVDAETLRTEAIDNLKKEMEDLQNYNPMENIDRSRSVAEQRKQLKQLIADYREKLDALKKREYYKDEALKNERESFESAVNEKDDDDFGNISIDDMTDEEFLEYVSDEDDDGEGEGDEPFDPEKEGMVKFGDDEDQPEGKPEEKEYAYDKAEYSWYEGEGMTREEIEKERKEMGQERLDGALGAFGGLGTGSGGVQNALLLGAGVLGAFPEGMWNTLNEEIDKLSGGFNDLLESVQKMAVKELAGEAAERASRKAYKVINSPYFQKGKSNVTSASSLLLASDGKIIVDDGQLATAEAETTVAETGTSPLDDAAYGDFNWTFGGERKEKMDNAAMDGSVLISGLQINNRGLSFTFDNGLESWGISNGVVEGGSHGGAYACLFVQDIDGNWVGGKFEWVRGGDPKRGFENIYSGYNGWNLSNVPKTTTAAFVIVSKDGKKRSNVITAIWER